jgi:hypothetical protein
VAQARFQRYPLSGRTAGRPTRRITARRQLLPLALRQELDI